MQQDSDTKKNGAEKQIRQGALSATALVRSLVDGAAQPYDAKDAKVEQIRCNFEAVVKGYIDVSSPPFDHNETKMMLRCNLESVVKVNPLLSDSAASAEPGVGEEDDDYLSGTDGKRHESMIRTRFEGVLAWVRLITQAGGVIDASAKLTAPDFRQARALGDVWSALRVEMYRFPLQLLTITKGVTPATLLDAAKILADAAQREDRLVESIRAKMDGRT